MITAHGLANLGMASGDTVRFHRDQMIVTYISFVSSYHMQLLITIITLCLYT